MCQDLCDSGIFSNAKHSSGHDHSDSDSSDDPGKNNFFQCEAIESKSLPDRLQKKRLETFKMQKVDTNRKK